MVLPNGSQLSLLWDEVLSKPPPSNLAELWTEHLLIRGVLETPKEAIDHDQKHWQKLRKDRLIYLPPFLTWCSKMGVQYNSLNISPSPHGFCLITTESLDANEIIANVPLTATFSTDSAEKIDSLRSILSGDELIRSMDNVALAICIAHEILRGEESMWAAYFDVLPGTCETPIFYTEEQLQALKPSPVFEETLRMYRAVARQFVYFKMRILSDIGEKAKKHLAKHRTRLFAGSPFTPHNFDFNFYRWCVSIVSTRINMVPSRNEKHEAKETPKMIPALIPFIDMANHAHYSDNPGSVYYDPETNSVKIQLNKRLEVGQEVQIYYGARSNAKFLLHNAFVPELANPDDSFDLKIGMPRQIPNIDAKLLHLSKHSIFPTTNQNQKNTIFNFHLKPFEGSVETLKQSHLWIFAKVFVAIGDLEATIELEENMLNAKKFLIDRFTLLKSAYKEANMQNIEKCIAQNIKRLKDAEILLLNSYLKCIEEI